MGVVYFFVGGIDGLGLEDCGVVWWIGFEDGFDVVGVYGVYCV